MVRVQGKKVFIYDYIGSYFTILPALDAVVFTGGIGENSTPIRRSVCRYLARLGAAFDESRNRQAVGGQVGPITADGCPTPVWVIPTNEELMIARDTAAIVKPVSRG